MKRTRIFWNCLQRNGLLVVTALAVIGMYTFRLSTLPSSYLSQAEQNALITSRSLDALLSSPFFLPLSALRYALLRLLPGHETLAARIPSVVVVILAIGAMLYLTRRWYGKRTLLFGIILILCSAWFLHIGRSATNDIAYLAAAPLLLASSLLLYEYPERKIFICIWAFMLVLAIYIPGLIWFVAATVILQRQAATDALSKTPVLFRFSLVVFVAVLLIPFVYTFARHLNLDAGLTWLGLPSAIPSWDQPLKDGAAAVLFLFVRTPENPALWLGRLPLLDVFLTVSFVAGVFFYTRHMHAERTRLLLVYGAVALLLCVAGLAMARSLIVPIAYLIALGGIAYILYEWLKLFPRNPLARRLGIGLVFVAVGLSGLYGLRQYYVAWPHNVETINAFRQTNHDS